ncbi:MAG: hypothetical protein JW704_13955 [Anaerolineaceae bacterium]|nr:hypothetical protein [Anaerolineaceae bacterium]MBN2676580.1 hypothetical protein [Anaerolineaceae bacterium]
MRFLLDDYFLAYTDGKRELDLPLSQPVPLSEILEMANIPVWEQYQLVVNGKTDMDLARTVNDEDEVKIIPMDK